MSICQQNFHTYKLFDREQLQQQHSEFMSTRRQLAQVNRENERLSRDVEEINMVKEVWYWV